METITKAQLAAILQVSTRTIDRKRAAGEILAPINRSGHPRWSATEIERWMAVGGPRAEVWKRLRGRS